MSDWERVRDDLREWIRNQPKDAACSYCSQDGAEFEDLDGDPICGGCSTPEES